MGKTDYSKGDDQRPAFIPRTERELRHDLAFGKLSYRDFLIAMSKISQPHKDYLNEEKD